MFGTSYSATLTTYASHQRMHNGYSIPQRIEFLESNIARLVMKGLIPLAREDAVTIAQLRDCELTHAEWEAGYEARRACQAGNIPSYE